MELKEMTVEALEERKNAIVAELDNEGADLNALEEEMRAIKAELEERMAAEAKKAEIRASVAAGEGVVVKNVEQEERKMPTFDEVRNSKEYVDAYARYIKTNDETECRSLLSENATNGTVAVPELVYDIIKNAWEKEGIMSRVRKSYVKGNLKVGFEISSDGAVIHTEGSGAVNEENLTLGIVEMVPQSIKKWISFSDEAMDLSGAAFLEYIYDELTYQIAKKAADTLVAKIDACGTASTATCVGVPVIEASSASVGLVAQAMAALSDQAANPVIIMNKATWGTMKGLQYANKFNVDPFEGLDVVFNSSMKSFDAATSGDTYMIVGDLSEGALANFPNGEEINLKFDDISLATSDLVKVVGREFIALGVIGPKAFVKVQK